MSTPNQYSHPSDEAFQQIYPTFSHAEKVVFSKIPRAVVWSAGISMVSEAVEGGIQGLVTTNASIEVPASLQTAETASHDIGIGGMALVGATALYIIGRGLQKLPQRHFFRVGWDSRNQAEQ